MLHNGFEWFEVLNAAGKLGAQLVPVGYRMKGPEIAYMAADSRAKVIVAAPDLHDEIDRAMHELPLDERCPVGHRRRHAVARTDRTKRGSPTARATEPDGGFVGSGFNVMIYTSGTTGRPKGIERPTDPATAHLTILGHRAAVGPRPTPTSICWPARMYHTGPAAYAAVHVLIGATVVIMPRFDAAEALRLIERHRVSNTFMVPTHFSRILQLDDAARRRCDLSSLRLVLHSAAPCPAHVKRGIMQVFPPNTVTEFYGASESGFTKITAEEWQRKPGSVGRAWPGHELRILDEHGNPCPAGEIGLIYVKAPTWLSATATPTTRTATPSATASSPPATSATSTPMGISSSPTAAPT